MQPNAPSTPPTPSPRVVVTGASRGIGRATAIEFGRSGAHVFLVARDAAALEKASADVRASGGTATPVVADVSRDEGARAIAAAVDREGGTLDLLVANAGLFRVAPLLETDLRAHWSDLLDVNLTGTFLPTLRLLPALLRAPGPHWIAVLSLAAKKGFPWNAGYCASKWGARGLAESLRAEMGDRLRVTTILPGATDTDAWNGIPFPHDRARMIAPETVARAIAGAWSATHAPEEVVLETPPGAVGG